MYVVRTIYGMQHTHTHTHTLCIESCTIYKQSDEGEQLLQFTLVPSTSQLNVTGGKPPAALQLMERLEPVPVPPH